MNTNAKRGVLYIVWGNAADKALTRSIESVRAVHPELPIEVKRLQTGSLRTKTKLAELTPFETTLYLDADTVVLGDLSLGFEKAEQFGLACSICEAPWMRRYGNSNGYAIEYNTGVLFVGPKAKSVLDSWDHYCDSPSTSNWTAADNMPRGLQFDDQAGFSRAVAASGVNPFVLPINYNLRPTFHRAFFAPVKIWHDYSDVSQNVRNISNECERGQRPITLLYL
jgi:hypothetical protein